MAASFFFYDLETSGFSPSRARIMQFAGQRTDIDLNPIGEPVNVLIKLAPDVLPDPDAIMLTGITPQSTLLEGLTEAEFLKYFYEEVVQPDTTCLGYNTIRFDDEFMRYLQYRNFYDPYEWQWANGCSRWDLLDVVRMTRALRPEGIEWPVTAAGKPTNRLELLTKANGLNHDHAHDALSDVTATIAIARLIRDKQPSLFDYLLQNRTKKAVSELVLKGQPFVYTSGRYPSAHWHTSISVLLTKHPQQDCGLVYDLRSDPTPFLRMSPEQLMEAWRYKKDRGDDELRLPVKTLKYNRCPAVAPLGVMKDEATQARLDVTIEQATAHWQLLKAGQAQFSQAVLGALELMDKQRVQERPTQTPALTNVDDLLYASFVQAGDKQTMRLLRAAQPPDIANLAQKFQDARMKTMATLYQARNYPTSLSAEQRQTWETYVSEHLFTGGAASPVSVYFARLQALAKDGLTSEQEYLLEELQLYGESILPSEAI